jgi:hypothetical protein
MGVEEKGTAGGVFLVERYWTGVNEALLEACLPRLDRVAREMTSEGHTVEHLGSYLMAGDEVVFSIMRATSEPLIREANERAELPFDRIAEVEPHGFEHHVHGEGGPPG